MQYVTIGELDLKGGATNYRLLVAIISISTER